MLCKPCSSSDPVTDTVKVNPALLEMQDAEAKQKAEKAEAERREAEALKKRQEEERKRAEEAKKRAAEEEEKRRQQEMQEKLRKEEEAAEAARKRLAEEEERKEREAKEAKERAEREREEQERKALDQTKVSTWLAQNGFKDVNTLKKSMFKTSTPLHTAVAKNDASMVSLLLQNNADPTLKVSGKTASELAAKSDSKGSHAAVLAAFQT
mmetsp:Transcript_525/g.1198  ORF Transcript_525/g.1198 Transcript_525/m.1198 type:complete len:210 (+) Transcript_525:74-703(+)